MARLQSQSKLLYYPTLDCIVQMIASYFSTTARRARLVDPCCGTGKALRDIANTLPKTTEAEVLGIEMSYARALEAQKVLDQVLPVSFYNVAGGTSLWSQHSVGLLYNNPPYDWSGFDETMEV